jgi:hypothetical protein
MKYLAQSFVVFKTGEKNVAETNGDVKGREVRGLLALRRTRDERCMAETFDAK